MKAIICMWTGCSVIRNMIHQHCDRTVLLLLETGLAAKEIGRIQLRESPAIRANKRCGSWRWPLLTDVGHTWMMSIENFIEAPTNWQIEVTTRKDCPSENYYCANNTSVICGKILEWALMIEKLSNINVNY